MTNDQREIHRKKRVLEYPARIGNIKKACRYFGVARSIFYISRDRYQKFGGHRLRAEFITSAVKNGASVSRTMDASLHRRVEILSGYVRRAE